MNWTTAIPEIFLACAGLAILVFGVLRGRHSGPENAVVCSMIVLGAFGISAMLIIGGNHGIGYNGQFTTDAFSSYAKLLILAGAALGLVLSLDYNRLEGLARFEFPVCGAVLAPSQTSPVQPELRKGSLHALKRTQGTARVRSPQAG